MPTARLDLDRLKNHVLQTGDLVITRTAAYLRQVGLFDDFRLPALAGAFSIRFQVDETKVLPKFQRYFFNSERGQASMQTIATGSAQPNLNIPRLHSLDIPCPPIADQRRILAALSSLDDKIDLLQRQNKNLETMAAPLFRQWFVEEASDDWEVTTFVEHFDASRGLSYKGSGLTTYGLGLPMHNLNSVFWGWRVQRGGH